ncbi:MAG: radical SAM family heme chaperone HemW [bacterium]
METIFVRVPNEVYGILNPRNNLGIYIHYPFCIKKCFYCDFFKETNFKYGFYQTLIQEIEFKIKILQEWDYKLGIVDTVYFGGGTPNLMSLKYLEEIIDTLKKYFNFSSNVEISFEINPEFISEKYIRELRSLGINRISIGVQSLNIFGLRVMGRTHNISEIYQAIRNVERYFDNYNLDMIALYPYQTFESLKKDIDSLLSIGSPHLSYYLMCVDKSEDYPDILKQKVVQNYAKAGLYYRIIVDKLSKIYDQYEISNFAIKNFYCKHNLKYWYYYDYIGFGPSAVSKVTIDSKAIRIQNNFDGLSYEIEYIDINEQVKERIMLGLRTRWGIWYKDKKLRISNFEEYNTKALEILGQIGYE